MILKSMRSMKTFFVFVLFFCYSCGLIGDDGSKIEYGLKTENQLNKQLKVYIKKLPSEKGVVGYIDFKNDHFVDQASYLYVKEALAMFKKQNVAFVIVHLDCLGGSFFPTIKIADLFQKFDVNQKVPLIAYIDNYAIGSGAMLAYACRFICVSENAYMGGRLPDQKISIRTFPDDLLPYIFNEYSNLAAFYGRDPVVAEAMADLQMIMVEREGKLLGFYNKMDVNLESDRPDIIVSEDRQLLTLSGAQLIKYGIADFLIKDPKPFDVTKKTLFANTPLSLQPYLKGYSLWPLSLFSSWQTTMIQFLTKPYVSALLLFGIVVSLYLQIRTSRLGIFTFASIFFLSLILFTSITIDALSWIEVLFLTLGLAIIMFDCLLVKGSNFALFFGIGLTIFSVFMMLLPGFEKFSLLDFEAFSFAAGSLMRRITALFVALISSVVVIGFLEKEEKRKRINKKDPLEMGSSAAHLGVKVGDEGIAYSSLRPFGKVMIEDTLYEAQSFDQEVILKKTSVIVVEVQEKLVVVKEKEN